MKVIFRKGSNNSKRVTYTFIKINTMKKISVLSVALLAATIGIMAQVKPACKKLMETINKANFEVKGEDGTVAKNIKLIFEDCNAHYTFDMVAGDEGGSLTFDFSFEDVMTVELKKEENVIILSLYEGKEANSKMNAGGEVMEDKTAEIRFKFPDDKNADMLKLIREAVKECNDAFLDVDWD